MHKHKTYVYIDGANLHQGSKSWGGLDYQKFKVWLHDKYKAEKIFLFLGYIKGKEPLYSNLSTYGYNLIFKETLEVDGKVKGNCDAELVVQAVSNFYEDHTKQTLLVTGDGDFACLVDFFLLKKHTIKILAPNRLFCSYLLKKRNVPIIFLEELKHKFKQIDTKKVKKSSKKSPQ